MEQRYDSFPKAVKAIITEYGQDVMSDIKFHNIVSDVFTLDNIPGARTIIRKMISDGYGTEMISILANQPWDVKTKMLASKIASQNGFREDIVTYIIDSIAYGLGKREDEPKEILTTFNITSSITELEIELKKLKGEYLTFLEDNVMIDDEQPAFFNTNDKSDIYEYREKIRMLCDALGKGDFSWCDERMNEVLQKYAPKPKSLLKRGFLKRLFGS